ncbi:Stp1/IreP family PP2C-type Ser/Thr phosphatase [Sulfurivermis fontis]|uniref:Stp1/IreP family PP2C-type Ser/Thr phosphatase n=1 Tax=Sulfurivermis fontis TaxID=1972068 RepID=UPI0018D4F118|nr:Stp1/IreP family PP2C-type Ser/Thr phosphatase [Sulfurivermis fontis]
MDSVPTLQMSGRTDVGCAREHNEDQIAWDASAGLALLADGMGGHNAGEVASALAISVLHPLLRDLPADTLEQEVGMQNAVADANKEILHKAASDVIFNGMGTTLALALFRGKGVMIGHVGDSRVYRLRGEQLTQLTADHSLLQELVASGFMTADEAAHAVNKNVITRALGIEPNVDVEVHHHEIEPGDIYLLCSDGLNDMVTDNSIAKLLMDNRDNLDVAADALVAEANRCGGNDNISVILVRVVALKE